MRAGQYKMACGFNTAYLKLDNGYRFNLIWDDKFRVRIKYKNRLCLLQIGWFVITLINLKPNK